MSSGGVLPFETVTLRRLRWITIAAGLVLLAALIVLTVLARVGAQPSPAASSAPAPLAVGTALQRPPRVPPFVLIDERGKPFSTASWHGKWVVLAPSMTLCHEVCPMTTGALMQLTSRIRSAGLAKRVVVAEVTVDPWRDTPARLRAYRRLTGVNFEMLTGTTSEIHRLWKYFGVYYHRVPQGKPPDIDWLTHKPETFDVAHSDALFFLDPAGQERIIDEGMAEVTGGLPASLKRLLSPVGEHNLAHPQLPWTAADALDDVDYLMGRNISTGTAATAAPPTPQAALRALAGSPAPLASLHAQASQLLGSETALAARVRDLRGKYPVIVNAWASWCPPCRAEFPLFATAAAKFGRRVGFLGADTDDSASDARSFLRAHPVSYPSYQSSSTELHSLAVIEGTPTTIFISATGKVVDVHDGQYESQTALENDIEHYALGVSG